MQLVKNWPYALLLLFGLIGAISACKNDDQPAPVLSITSVSPTTAPAGSTVVITGANFNSTPASNSVTFGTVPATVASATSTQLVVTVPAGAGTPITVTSGGQSASIPFTLGAKPVITVTGSVSANTTWTRNNVYLIRGFVYVTTGAVLTIEPGTIIKGATRDLDPEGQSRGGTLIVEQGARLEAKGTATQPIVFTSSKAPGQRTYGDWGGIVLIGRAPTNRPGSTLFEGGIRGQYGTGNTANDNSGTLEYVRIEFPGIALSATANSEVNGLTLYGVGSDTKIDHVQVSYSGDDAFEWFGGTVNAKYLVAHRTFDDDWDTDFGFTGKVQFGVSLRDPEYADQSGSNGFESDNFGGTQAGEPATAMNNGLPLTAPIFANISNFVTTGAPSTATVKGSGGYQSAMHLRRNTSISIYNSVFVGYPEGLRLEGTPTGTLANTASGGLELQGIVLANTGTSSTSAVRGAASITNEQALAYYNQAARKNVVIGSTDLAALLLNGANFNLTAPNFLPGAGSPLLVAANAATGGKLADPFFTPAPYRGAFNTENWTTGWTNFDPQNTNYDL